MLWTVSSVLTAIEGSYGCRESTGYDSDLAMESRLELARINEGVDLVMDSWGELAPSFGRR
jgi:hypothetical protein